MFEVFSGFVYGLKILIEIYYTNADIFVINEERFKTAIHNIPADNVSLANFKYHKEQQNIGKHTK